MTPTHQNFVRRPWLAVALLAGVTALCVALGCWQLGRAEESRLTAARMASASELPVVGSVARSSLAELRYRKLEVRGRYVPERQFLLDNIVHNGVAGYYVLTPFEPDVGNRWLVVNRGWVPAGADRSVLPKVEIEPGKRQIAGTVNALPAPGLRLGRAPIDASEAAVRVLTYPTIAELESSLGRPLLDYQLLLDAGQPDGFERDFRASVPVLQPERHLGYAGQWWLFAAIAGGAASVIGWRELRRRLR